MSRSCHRQYARRAASVGGPRRRHPGWLLGVCGGLADYFDVSATGLRVLTVIGSLLFFPFVPVAYFVAALLMKPARERWDSVMDRL